MRAAVIGAVDFSRHSLEALIADGREIAGVIALDPRQAARHGDYADLAPVAAGAGIPFVHVQSVNDSAVVAQLLGWRPDVVFVLGWSQLIGRAVRGVPPRGCIGSHPARLPQHRGRHPIVWSLVHGLTESALTFFYLDDGADSGDIVWQRSFPITTTDDAGTLLERVKALAVDGLREMWPQLEAGCAPRIPQDHAAATYWRKREERDGEIDWSSSTASIHNLVRALTRPYVGAHGCIEGRMYRIWRVRPEGGPVAGARGATPGAVLARDPHLRLRTGDGVVTIVEYERR